MIEAFAFVRFVLVTYGFIYLVTQAAIMTPVRVFILGSAKKLEAQMFLAEFIYCRACTGFWIGILVGAFGLYPWEAWVIEPGVAAMALGAFWKPGDAFENEAPLWDHLGWARPFEDERAVEDEVRQL